MLKTVFFYLMIDVSKQDWKNLNNTIIHCKKCKRLVAFREKIAKNKTKRFNEWNYWGKPVTGYGNQNAQLIIFGLAPAAHGGNRTGRVFTGDKSADFLVSCLYKSKLTNQPISINKNDGLKLFNSYKTPVLKCVPPNDKPTSNELTTCFEYFKKEISLLKNSKVFLALGKIAFDACVKFFKEFKYINKNHKLKFGHGVSCKINNKLILIGSYHPSPRNVNTGRLDSKKMILLLNKIKKRIE